MAPVVSGGVPWLRAALSGARRPGALSPPKITDLGAGAACLAGDLAAWASAAACSCCTNAGFLYSGEKVVTWGGGGSWRTGPLAAADGTTPAGAIPSLAQAVAGRAPATMAPIATATRSLPMPTPLSITASPTRLRSPGQATSAVLGAAPGVRHPYATSDRAIRTIVRQLLLYAALTRGHHGGEPEGL